MMHWQPLEVMGSKEYRCFGNRTIMISKSLDPIDVNIPGFGLTRTTLGGELNDLFNEVSKIEVSASGKESLANL